MCEPQEIIILGISGTSIDVLDTIHEINARSASIRYRCIGFLDDNPEVWGQQIVGLPVLGSLADATRYAGAEFVNGIGSDTSFWAKEEIVARTQIPVDRFASIIHPTASISRMSELGRGTVVLQNVTIASRARVGNHVMILPNSIVSHDAIIEDYATLAGGVCLSGGVVLEHSCYIGSNSSIIGSTRIGAHALVGMGSVVLHDVSPDSVVVGNPARFLRPTRTISTAE
jgi:sugar O-acyltransferase (sialic acid O-acetyltransferase NeuD family)